MFKNLILKSLKIDMLAFKRNVTRNNKTIKGINKSYKLNVF